MTARDHDGLWDCWVRWVRRVGGAALILAWMVASGVDVPEPAPAEGIRFLLIKASGSDFTLRETSVRPGRLKQPRDGQSRGDVVCELLDADRNVLWQGRVEDPLKRRYEFTDPADPGRLQVREVRLAEAEFTLRVPHLAAAVEVRLRRDPSPEIPGKNPSASAAGSRLALPKTPTLEPPAR